MKYIKLLENFNIDTLVSDINNSFKNIFGKGYKSKEIKGGILLPIDYYNNLSDNDREYLSTSLGLAVDYSKQIIEEKTNNKNKKRKENKEEKENIKVKNKNTNNNNYYFLRWTSSQKDDIKRNFSGHMRTWVDTEKEAWEKRNLEIKQDGRHFEFEPKYDPTSGMWNYDPEWGISGYYFKDKDSFDEAMEKIKDIEWYHKDINQQDLALFSAKEMGESIGYDGEELFRGLTFIKFIDTNTPYNEIRELLN